jgi:nitroimidazol reductase NimA-like FMN-containing flavoprotein (pyridoxamine 5'-phosphate oxidase superfamily)
MIGILVNEEIENVLTGNVLGRLGCNDGSMTYIIPINYVYDGKYIIAHAVEGLKIRIMRERPNVCFAVDEIKDHRNWKSVVTWGEFQELKDERDRLNAMKLFVDRMLYLKISDTAIPPETVGNRVHPRSVGVKPVIYRIVLTRKTGRYEMD